LPETNCHFADPFKFVGGLGPALEQSGSPLTDAVFVVYGEVTTQFFGDGGISGVGKTVLVGVSNESAADPNVFPDKLALHPPPSHHPECVPSERISSATLLDTVVGPHGGEY
jgi:hypothetical protein